MSWIKRGTETSVEEVFLRNIGASSLEEVNGWFRKSYADGYRIDRLDEAVALAMGHREGTVTIVGDYDADGITSTAILKMALGYMGFKDVRCRIPKRFSEGYGINMKIIDEIDDGLVITCDNGIGQLGAIRAAKEKGLPVIILDHHLPAMEDGKAVLPEADVAIDPNAVEGSADFCGYCGAGLCYRFARRLLGDAAKQGGGAALMRKLLALAAIGTVADAMDLREENYVLVRNGLKHLLHSGQVTNGLHALACAFSLRGGVTAKDVAFKIAPALNACSRMKDDGAMDAVSLVTFDGAYQEAVRLAEAAIAVNEARKEAKAKALEAAEAAIEEGCLYGEVPLVIWLPAVKEGIIGIIAGALCEEYKVPAIVLTEVGGGMLRGSARACAGYHMKDELDKVSGLLSAYGGHEGAAGLSLRAEDFDAFKEAICRNAEGFAPEEAGDVYYDLEIRDADIPKVMEELRKYEPFGKGNAEIVFKVTDVATVPRYGGYKKLMGADGTTVKMWSKHATAVGFGMAGRLKKVESPKLLDLVGTLSENHFNGDAETQVEFQDVKVKELQAVETPLAAKLRMMAMGAS